MKTIAIIEVDLVRTPLGTRSRLADDLHGKPLLARTVERISAARRLDERYAVCPFDQVDRCRALLEGLSIQVHGCPPGPPPYRELTRVGRKWSLDGWRGGIGGGTTLDEYTHCPVFASLAEQVGADAVWSGPPAAPLLDPLLIDEMIAHYEAHRTQMRIVFAQAPPGLTGVVFETTLLTELAEKRTSPGWVLAYKPDAPAMDLAFKDCCYPTAQPIRHAAGRLIADTDRSWRRVSDLLGPDGDKPMSATAVGERLIAYEQNELPALPLEVEIELTTDDQLATTILRPRGREAVGKRGPINIDLIRGLAEDLAAVDDARVALGGFGEPLLHPQFAEIISLLRQADVYAIAVKTNALALDDDAIVALLDGHVDVVSVFVDATSEETYEKLNGRNRLADVRRAIKRLTAARLEHGQVSPIIVTQMTKVRDNMGQMEAFTDEWLRQGIWPNIVGYSHRAGQCTDRAVMSMAPPLRVPCRRLPNRLMVLADGTVVACDQDFGGSHPLGRLTESCIGDIWQGQAMTAMRASHEAGEYEGLELCRACDEWHRP